MYRRVDTPTEDPNGKIDVSMDPNDKIDVSMDPNDKIEFNKFREIYAVNL